MAITNIRTPKAMAVNPVRMSVTVPVVQVIALQQAVTARTQALRNARTVALAELQSETYDIATLRLALLAIAKQADEVLKS